MSRKSLKTENRKPKTNFLKTQKNYKTIFNVLTAPER